MCSPIYLYVKKESFLTIQIPKFGGKRSQKKKKIWWKKSTYIISKC